MTDRGAPSRHQAPGPSAPGPLHRRGLGRRRAADPALQTCPYLRPGSREEWVLAGPTPGDRCRAGERPIHVGKAYQSSVCRSPDYRNCPRFVEDTPAADSLPAGVAGGGRRQLLRSGIPSVVSEEDWAAETSQPAAPSPVSHTRANLTKSRRRMTLVEVMVMGLGVSIAFAFLFVGYAIVYRLQLRSGIEVAAAPPRTPPPTARPASTLVPTFTPLPLPTATPDALAAGSDLATHVPERAPVEPTLPPPTPVLRPPATSPPTRLVIPRIDVDIPVRPVGVRITKVAGKERVVWSDVPNAAAFHETSAYPGNPGNTVINGHRDILGSVFRHLDRLEVGDEVVLYVGDTVYPYLVTETMVVPETFASAAQRVENARLIGYMPEERLTLITCTPVGLATHRLLVIAKPADQVAPQMPEAGSNAGF